MNAMKCHNCHGMGHRSVNCPLSPSHRRCYTCGKAGGTFDHRAGCKDAWYDLSKPVPRDTLGKLYTRELAIQFLLVDSEAEKESHNASMRRSAPKPMRVVVPSQNPKRVCSSAVQATTATPVIETPAKSIPPEKVDNIRPPTKTGEPTQCEATAMQSEARASTMVQDVRILDGLLTPDGRQILKREHDKENTMVYDGERTFHQSSAMGFSVRLNEADAQPSVALPDVLLRFVFRKSPRVFVDSGTKNDFELTIATLRMSNGLRVTYDKARLDICGQPDRDTIFSVVAPNGSFRVAIRQACVEINDMYFLSEFGMACLAKSPMMLPATPQFLVTLVGPAEDEIRVRYKQNRYLLTIDSGMVRINPFDAVN